MSRPRMWVELCCGSAAVALRLVGGPSANPPISYQGSKRGYARVILAILGLRQGLGADEVWLNDPGPWVAVWACLTQPGKAEEVAAIIRGWQNREPRKLWNDLKAQGWGELTEAGEVAAWANVSAWCFEAGNTRTGFVHPSDARPEREAIASRVEAVARWLVCQHWSFSGKGPENGYGGPGSVVNAPTANWTTEQRDKALGCERFNGLVMNAAQSLATPVRTFHGSALDVPIPDDCREVFCYIDPPYSGTTGYQHDLPRADVLALARHWSDAGAVVCVSEAEPLPLEGWHHVEIGGERVGQKRTFSRQQAEWLTLNRPPAWTPGVQVGLFG